MTVVPGKYCRRVLVVQGAWVDGRLALWGEGGAPLTGVVDGKLDELTVLLPTAGGRPVPSPEAAGDGPPDVDDLPPDAPVLAPWPVAAARLEPRDALAWLGDLPDPDALDDAGWVAGASVRYLAVLAGYAAGLVRRGRLLPQLVDGPAARWRPVLTGRDAAAFREFVSALPPVTRAAAADRSGGDIVRDALDGLVDAAARRAMPERLLLGHRPGPKAPLADRWAVALTADDPTLTVPPSQRGDLTVLRAELERWLRDAHEANSAFRVCFRLVEPVLVDDEWTLEFGLQSADDPGLYVPAELLWAGRRVPGFPDRPDEALLAGLGRASRLFTPLHGALREARPATTRIGTTTAYDFLRQAAPLLQAAGYGVQLPAWAGRKSIGMRLTTRAKSSSGPKGLTGGDFGLDQLVDFQVDLLVGDEKVSADDLTALARLKVPLLRVRGRWVELDDRQLQAAIRAVERHRSGELTVAEVLGEVAAGGDEDLPLVEVDADGWLGDLLSGAADQRLAPTPTPATFQGALRPYQERGLSWLHFLSRLGLGGVLADDMGLGKTAQTLSLLLAERERDDAAHPTLLVCPMSLVCNWQKEAEKFAPSLRVYVHHGGGRLREDELAARVEDCDLVLTTYGTALRDLSALRDLTWSRVVCDEAQAIKNSGTRQAQAVRAIPARTRLALTGTPVENHLAELWSIMDFANPGLLGPAKTLPPPLPGADRGAAGRRRRRGAQARHRPVRAAPPQDRQDDHLRPAGEAGDEGLVPAHARAGHALPGRRRRHAGEDREQRGHRAAGQRAGRDDPAQAGLQPPRPPAARRLQAGRALRQAGPPRGAGRRDRRRGRQGPGLHPVRRVRLAAAAATSRPISTGRCCGCTAAWRRSGATSWSSRFQTDDEPMIFLLSLKAAGTGLNLTAANHVIHVDRWWNPAVEDQATDRAFRIGQSRNVQVRKFICTGTLEERIDEMIERKKALAQRVVGTGEDWITELSTSELRDLFALDPKAVS